ncbi:MAG: hypothetical protein WA705_02185 [Candidatus Ozemobacteraceae bacterium]
MQSSVTVQSTGTGHADSPFFYGLNGFFLTSGWVVKPSDDPGFELGSDEKIKSIPILDGPRLCQLEDPGDFSLQSRIQFGLQQSLGELRVSGRLLLSLRQNDRQTFRR